MADTTLPKAMETLAVSSKTKELRGTEKRDTLIEIEKRYQQKWEEDHVFEVDAPSIDEFPLESITADELREKFPKFFGTIAYPYMNGRLHAGHAFSFSKIEFHAGYARMQGKRTLFPLGYHCTGLPIKASADKLVKEVQMFGRDFENYKEEDEVEEAPVAAKGPKDDLSKFNAKKGKAAAKTVKAKYQFQILNSVGIPLEEIHHFADPQYWLQFFPPECKKDLTNFGARIDWRRQFVTTDANPYYDAFVRWQMVRLKELEKIKFGKRYTIYSIKDGQPCMDHDRSEGEGVLPQEYTALKLKVVEWAPKAAEAVKGKIPEDAKVYLVPATLRAETMYGQTCCFVGPSITYGLYKASDKEYFVITERAARNMAYQGIFEKEGVPEKAADVLGSDLIGTVVNAPLSFHKEVRVLPMESVLATKGTGVVTSVPSDSPDDYAMVTELAKKADFYGIKKEWAELEIIPIIQTPTSDLLAPYLVKKLKIASPKDAKQLLEAKELAYKEGFYQGVMKVGEFAGEKVEAAKPKVREQLIKAGEAFAYSEPENKVVSRSGDECTVALMDQWYIDYGEDSWRTIAYDYVENKDGKGLETYSPDTQHAFKGVLNWLKQWACARTYGLGSKLPWDPTFLVESLSDSTIYMAYYTLVPWLHTDLFGREQGKGKIAPEQMIDEVWDYVFARTQLTDELVTKSGIPKETLQGMRRDFEYFYPLDLRVSGKDLIPNHLTFWLYNHIALFPREFWPKSVRANGHLQLNGAKMAKSTGNFMTLDDVVKKYGADAARVALADAGDTIADSNFVEDVADNTILRFYTNKEWIEETVKDESLRTGELNDFQDVLFDNEMNALVAEAKKHYEETSYKLALKAGHYDFLNARDTYREACTAAGIPLHKDLVFKYIRLQALLLTPIAPHWADFVWQEILGEKTSIQFARWPDVPASDAGLTAAREYVRQTSSNINSAEASQLKKMAKGRQSDFDPKKPKKLTIFLTEDFPTWQAKYIELLKEVWDPATNSQKIDDKELNGRIGKMGEMKKAMPFVQALKKRLRDGEPASAVLERKLAFDEKKTLLAMVPGLKRAAGLESVQIVAVQEGSKQGKDLTANGAEVEVTAPVAEAALPGQPSFFFTNV
ncbi:cytosolic leucyl tRNA synthetase [Podospora pseudopauciseta]|uniref:leucine--tRNA ligase n=2 Tax=Podospora TaxID=5144 RepID=A0ABR0HHQ7_9PEZI|nr:cytosolic leucyl tRNA synthetase [Podospora pseudopauciseta]KAK4678721.1 cytosolic leucyl tRNA synthetase [Podospora pseudoanserina]